MFVDTEVEYAVEVNVEGIRGILEEKEER